MNAKSNIARQFGSRIRYLRILKKLTQNQLAEQCDLSSKQIGRIERGDSSPSFAVLEKLCQVLETNLVNLFLFHEKKVETNNASSWINDVSENFGPRRADDTRLPVSKIGTWIVCSQSGQTTWTAAIYELLGYRPFSVKPSLKRFLKHVHPDARKECRSFVQEAGQERARGSIRVELIAKNQHERIVLIHADMAHGQQAGTGDVHLIVQDITDWLALNNALVSNQEELEGHVLARNKELVLAVERYELEAGEREKAEQRLRICKRMVDSSLDAQAFVDSAGIIVRTNNAYERLVDDSAGQLVGRRYDSRA